MTEPTKRPWKISNYRPYGLIQRDPKESTYERGDDEFPFINLETPENAELIVRAVNSFDALLEVAKRLDQAVSEAREMLGVFEDSGGRDNCEGRAYLATIDHMDQARSMFRKAIAQASPVPSKGSTEAGE